jgi:hypothetical protein
MAIVAVSWGLFLVWVSIEWYTAPTLDQQGRTVKPGRKLEDIFKKKK